MENVETKVKRLEVMVDNLDERFQDFDVRLIAHEKRAKQAWPVLVLYARRNLLNLISIGLALVSIIMQLTKQ